MYLLPYIEYDGVYKSCLSCFIAESVLEARYDITYLYTGVWNTHFLLYFVFVIKIYYVKRVVLLILRKHLVKCKTDTNSWKFIYKHYYKKLWLFGLFRDKTDVDLATYRNQSSVIDVWVWCPARLSFNVTAADNVGSPVLWAAIGVFNGVGKCIEIENNNFKFFGSRTRMFVKIMFIFRN